MTKTLSAVLILAASCALVEIPDTSGLRFHPGAANEVLSSGDHVWVEFPFAADKESAESIMNLSDFAGNLPGRLWR